MYITLLSLPVKGHQQERYDGLLNLVHVLWLGSAKSFDLVGETVDGVLVAFPQGRLGGLVLYADELDVLPQLHELGFSFPADVRLCSVESVSLVQTLTKTLDLDGVFGNILLSLKCANVNWVEFKKVIALCSKISSQKTINCLLHYRPNYKRGLR